MALFMADGQPPTRCKAKDDLPGALYEVVWALYHGNYKGEKCPRCGAPMRHEHAHEACDKCGMVLGCCEGAA